MLKNDFLFELEIEVYPANNMDNYYYLVYWDPNIGVRFKMDENIAEVFNLDVDEYIQFMKTNFNAIKFEHLYYNGLEDASNAQEWMESIIMSKYLTNNRR